MADADAVAFIANGTSSRTGDYYSTGRSVPTKDTQKDIQSKVISVNAGWVKLRASRKLDTGDANDFVIPLDTPFDLGLAINHYTNDFHS